MICFVLFRVDGVFCVGQSLVWALLLCYLLCCGAWTSGRRPCPGLGVEPLARRLARAASPPSAPCLRACVRRAALNCFINPSSRSCDPRNC